MMLGTAARSSIVIATGRRAQPAWNVGREEYGALVAIIGTLVSALLALVIGVPISLGMPGQSWVR
jgi:ABC-type phosphate transport system permease subunit